MHVFIPDRVVAHIMDAMSHKLRLWKSGSSLLFHHTRAGEKTIGCRRRLRCLLLFAVQDRGRPLV